MKKLTSLITVIAITFLFTGCATQYHLVNVKEYTPITDTFFEGAAYTMVLKGNCVPIELKTVVLPAFTKIKLALDEKEVKLNPTDIIAMLKNIATISEKDMILYSMIAVGIDKVITKITEGKNLTIPLSGERLETMKIIIEINLSGINAAVSVTDLFGNWCK